MKVWTVESFDLYDPAECKVLGIFSTKENADFAADRCRVDAHFRGWNVDVYEYELDKLEIDQ